MLIWWFSIGFLSRLIIHIPDATPITTLALFSPRFFSLRKSLLMILSILVISDLCLHFLCHYAVFGSWSFFTYSGWLLIIFLGYLDSKNQHDVQFIIFTLGATLFFWLWSNIGTWCATQLYPHTFFGLLTCYDAAIPFLKNSLIANLFWSTIFYYLLILRRLISSDRNATARACLYTQVLIRKDAV